MAIIRYKDKNVVFGKDNSRFSMQGIYSPHNIRYLPWEGFLDLSEPRIKMFGTVSNVDMNGVEYNSYCKNSHVFIYPGWSCLRVTLESPAEFFEYHKALRSNIASVLYEKGFPKTLVLIVHEFLDWYGSTLTLYHLDSTVNGDSSRCFFDMHLDFKRKEKNSQLILAKKFPPKHSGYVTHKIFIPKEALWESSKLQIVISFHEESVSHYWLQSMKISLSTEEEAIELPRNFNDIWDA